MSGIQQTDLQDIDGSVRKGTKLKIKYRYYMIN